MGLRRNQRLSFNQRVLVSWLRRVVRPLFASMATLATPCVADVPGTARSAPAPIEVVVAGRRLLLEHARTDPSVASTVLAGEALHRAGQTASDVLARVPGVQVSRTGAPSDLATASIRGSDSSQVPVYLAGIRINDDVSGSADLSTVPLWMIERVDVYRGNAPESADRLGMGGAIFFWPRQPRSTRVGASGELGSFGQRGGWLAFEAGSPDAGSLVAVRHQQARNDYTFLNDRGLRFDLDEVEERRDNADFVTRDAWAIGRLRGSPDARLSLVVHAFEREQGVTGLSVIPAEEARATVRRYLAGVSAQLPCSWGERCRVEAQASLLTGRLTLSDPFIELPSLRTRWLHSAGTRYSASLRGVTELSDQVELGLSANQSLEDIAVVRLENLSRQASRSSTRLSGVGTWRPSDVLELHALASLECHTTRGRTDRFGATVDVDGSLCRTLAPSGRVGLRASVAPQTELLANVGRYIRAPTLGELYGSAPLVEGAPSLSVEQAWTFDAGVRAQLPLPASIGRVSIDTFAFARHADDLIRFRRTGLSSAAPFNVASARVLGLETALAGELFGMLQLGATATLLDPRETTVDRALDPTPNDVLPLMSRLVVSGRLELFADPGWSLLAQDRTGVAVSYLHRSTRFDDPAGLTVLPAQDLFDLEASSSHFHARLLARLAIRNVLDARQLDWIGLPVPGRSVHGELEAWF
jgi:iron complex outermembrane receptor protein